MLQLENMGFGQQRVGRDCKKGTPAGRQFQPGGAPSQALKWAIESVAKAGTVSVIGVYSAPIQEWLRAKSVFGHGATMYMVLFATIGAASWPRAIPVSNVQGTVRFATLPAVICSSVLYRVFA